MTMIMATHQISLISTIADDILFMESGAIVEQGTAGPTAGCGQRL